MTTRPRASADADFFRTFMQGFPTGVAVVTTLGDRGEPLGFTCSSLCGLSLDPPLLLICVSNASVTLERIRARRAFTVNLLSEGGRWLAEVFSSPVPDRFARVRWLPTPRWSLPYLVDHAHAVAECTVADTYMAGDHTIVIGAMSPVIVRSGGGAPLLHGRRRYATWPEPTE